VIVKSPWKAVAALVDPVRRALYDYVRRQDHPVTREEAADGRRVSRSLAAFHLDKLVDAGLLRARYEAPADQPRGRGRAPKVYEPTADALAITVPERRYELIGEILADAVAGDPADARAAATRHAFDRGRAFGQAAVRSSPDELTAAEAALAGFGFEPQRGTAAWLTLHNCPFHALADRQRELVCGLNRAFVAGVLAGLGAEGVTAQLAPRPGACCVTVGPADEGS
jgi:predicted ArsR family transcriptional regulator